MPDSDTLQKQKQEMIESDNLRKQLAVAVRSIQWSYAIFWSLSTTKQEGVLEWFDGYYNGDIKTRKTVQDVELKHDKIGLQRSEHLRQLYKSLLDGDIDQQTQRPTAELSPDDLSDAEWYYLVCMSFEFTAGQSLPGRALANKETIWLCDAQYADSKVFARSLLAKSASIQTVVCFPHLDGVIELGVTERVAEDPSLIQHIKASLLDFSKPVCSEKSLPAHGADDDKDPVCARVDHKTVDSSASLEKVYTPVEDIILDQERIDEVHGNVHEQLNLDFPDDCSNGCQHNHQSQDSMLEGLHGVTSNVQSWNRVDDTISNHIQDSRNSSDCISEALVDEEKVPFSHEDSNVSHLHMIKLQEGYNVELNSLHYRRTLSIVLSSNQFLGNSCFLGGNNRSSFVPWRKEEFSCQRLPVHQNLLKKILISVPLMHGSRFQGSYQEHGEKGCHKNLEGYEICEGLSEKQEHEKFIVLKSMMPAISEIDKALILDDVIRYLKELEARVEELESCVDSADDSARPRMNNLDMTEQISDNYDRKIGIVNKLWINKRKASDIYYDLDLDEEVSDDGLPSDVKVSMRDKEVLVEMKCAYREYILLDIMDEINTLHLDVHSVQSSNTDGILTLTLKSKFRGTAVASVGMIKQALWKISK